MGCVSSQQKTAKSSIRLNRKFIELKSLDSKKLYFIKTPELEKNKDEGTQIGIDLEATFMNKVIINKEHHNSMHSQKFQIIGTI
ncbi:unnamed protein product [Blepharisma stoltei]|uniref:Uncharacterized protein n=1 Tax=Blepharisma stoltei TaxID=1481888 RepID=A0AAU9J258_9CILI|nr:unnamed protein product [Blepharisma stoltei]